ncbi:hypothetical protein SAMN05421595_1343 [Austwickia chelonae]|uniref:LemA family protein n=1 Tax=Austwickia chelonae NBRC 105200 TaxID=1184607 RepID=K6ULS7_9MICO|nr:hypothetical protein [Austwickia chelonae]GAB77506.1 hypothetical protein AUCHE_05_04180 [Austwickia chelonae NBRC 105200]SEW11721.1 hypothetical protein SAMN05421595_1343 [Austwickia chelonae]
MSVVEILTLVVLAVCAFGWYLTFVAARLDRLHIRVEGTYAALDAQLVRRAEAALEVANSGALDPAEALILAGAATDSLEGAESGQEEREGVESDLTRVIRLVVADRGDVVAPVELAAGLHADVALAAWGRLESSGQRVMMARRFHNDAVVDVQRLRRRVLVRLFRLPGRAVLPRTVEFDDDPAGGR